MLFPAKLAVKDVPLNKAVYLTTFLPFAKPGVTPKRKTELLKYVQPGCAVVRREALQEWGGAKQIPKCGNSSLVDGKAVRKMRFLSVLSVAEE
ncbi:MAG: hypothetical protein FWC50_12455 [Planctomycetaceae bacterium]|nr:hypothetical protein [Planctomycetaceae bacterium]